MFIGPILINPSRHLPHLDITKYFRNTPAESSGVKSADQLLDDSANSVRQTHRILADLADLMSVKPQILLLVFTDVRLKPGQFPVTVAHNGP